jgi:exodeoxyribonuclease VII large subunit
MMTPEMPDHPILTVSQLSQAIKHALEKTFPLVWLQGEISNFTCHTSGHLYFSLKDPNAQISAAMFRPNAAMLKAMPKNGMQVLVRGEINVYPISGKYQIVVREMRPIGIGELLLKLEELKIKLNKKGWFRSDRKKPLPAFPQSIGVVTSPTGAAIQDMLNILTRRFSGFHLILNPVRVQGEGAAQEIAQAIDQFNRYNLVEVMIVGRGGGSFEDLWAFNEEIVAEAIFNSKIPIISAVGHETDHCIADYVADVRAPTPSAAAELVIAEKAQEIHRLSQMKRRMQHTMLQQIRQDRHRLLGLIRHPVLQTPYGILGAWIQQLDASRQAVDDAMGQKLAKQKLLLSGKRQQLLSLRPAAKLEHYRQKLSAWDRELKATMQRKLARLHDSLHIAGEGLERAWKVKQASLHALFQAARKSTQLDRLWQITLEKKKVRFKHLKDSLDAINPKNLLTKGYCILFSEKEHSAITSVHSAEKDEKVRILLSDGDLLATINEAIPK